jgi:hypothetical protein
MIFGRADRPGQLAPCDSFACPRLRPLAHNLEWAARELAATNHKLYNEQSLRPKTRHVLRAPQKPQIITSRVVFAYL